MLAPGGILGSDLGDVELVPRGEELHLFHLCVPNHDKVAHLVSRDGLSWEPLPPALTVGPPGAFDDDMIWTVGIVQRDDGVYVMLYTALSTAEEGRVQRVGLATSRDLLSWEKRPGPVCEVDPRHYEASLETMRWIAWRDPKPLRVDGAFFAAISAREREGPFLRRGAVGLLSSGDGESWRAEPPVFCPRRFFELECPQIFRVGERFYLTAAIEEDDTQRYWIGGESPRGPWRTPAHDRLAPQGHYAGRVCEWGGESLLFAWRPGERGRVMPSPLVLRPEADGSLRPAPYPGWRGRSLGGERRTEVALEAGAALEEAELAGGEDDFYIEGEAEGDARFWGLSLGAGEDGGALFLEVEPEARRARLVHTARGRTEGGRPWFERRVLQEGWAPEPRGPFRLLAAGAEVELALGDRVVLSAAAKRTQRGAGAFTAGGRLAIRATLVPVSPP